VKYREMVVEMVNDRVARGVTRVVSTAIVLKCGGRKEKLRHYYFSWIVSLKNRNKENNLNATTSSTDYVTSRATGECKIFQIFG
jgi:hypothetical protein